MDEKGAIRPHLIVESFLTDVASIRSNAVFSGVVGFGIEQVARKQFRQFLDEHIIEEGETKKFSVPVEEVRRFKRLEQEFQRAQRGRHLISRGFIVTLVSQYDSFLSRLTSALFKLQPGLMHASKKTLELSEILKLGTLDDVKQAMVDEEIEDLLRESHAKQFTWLETKFNIKTLKKDLLVWPTFVEITERRNAFVHSDGKVSKQYLRVCREQGLQQESSVLVGTQLDADMSYVRHAADIFYEVVVKLSQVLWRKVLPEDISAADESLNLICFGLLEKKRYKLAIKLLDFALETIKKHSSTEWRLRLLINRANAYRLDGSTQRCSELVASEDWTAYSATFRLAASLLRNDVSEALVHMRTIGPDGEISKDSYRTWPLFEGFRQNASFSATFTDLFGEDLLTNEIVTSDIETLAEENQHGEKFLLEYLEAAEPSEVGFAMEEVQSASTSVK